MVKLKPALMIRRIFLRMYSGVSVSSKNSTPVDQVTVHAFKGDPGHTEADVLNAKTGVSTVCEATVTGANIKDLVCH